MFVPLAHPPGDAQADFGEALVVIDGVACKAGLVAGLLALSFVVQVTRVLQAYVFGRGLGIDVAFSYYLAFMPVCILIILLPISIGGLGVAQGVTIALLRPVGVPDEQSFALSTILVLAALLSATPGALLFIRHRMAGAQP